MFKMRYWDREFATERMREQDPFKNLILVNGIPIQADWLPAEIQETLRQEGLIR